MRLIQSDQIEHDITGMVRMTRCDNFIRQYVQKVSAASASLS
jgi:hypothetical protein